MSERESSAMMARAGSWAARSAAARSIFAAAMFAALVFALAAPSRAQAQSAAAKAAPTGQPTGKGQHEGITVFGRWVIEVKNPDGRVVIRREFENNLTSGANVLAGLLSGYFAPGVWEIHLAGAPGPCSTGASGSCTIAPSTGFQFTGCSTTVAAASPQPFCYSTMTESLGAISGGQDFTSFVLMGSAYIDTSTTISVVSTLINLCAPTPQAALAPGTPVTATTVSPSTCSTNLTNQTGEEFTSANVSVPVTTGQTVDATVTISFASPQ
ncbi:MAG: hypothetical protein WA871_02715 [Candidatus Acidiferrales bacterium]